MSDRKQIATLKEIFKKAKEAPRDDENWINDLKLHSEVRGALINVGKKQIYELADEIYPYLNDPFSEFRAEAVRTLGWSSRLAIREFCLNQAYDIWEKDLDEEVKIAALEAWCYYYSETKNKDVIKKLHDILLSKIYPSQIRAWALKAFLEVSGFLEGPRERHRTLDLGDLEDPGEFDKAVDWDRVNRIMTECVPGWKKET
jgi:hypothetical protein